jgi:hypothetical protein
VKRRGSVHFFKVRSAREKEGDARFACNGSGEHRLAGPCQAEGPFGSAQATECQPEEDVIVPGGPSRRIPFDGRPPRAEKRDGSMTVDGES